MSARRRRLLLAAATALLAAWAVGLAILALGDGDRDAAPAGASAVVHDDYDGPFRGGPLPEGLDGARAPAFSLPDARGGTLDSAELRGRPYVVTFLYTDCVDVCPLIAAELKQALEQLGPRGREVTVAAVSADPAGDTRVAVLRWLAERDMPANFRYLIGSRADLAPVWKEFFAAPQPAEREQSAHSASMWLVDRAGRLRTKFSGGVPVPPQDIAHDLRLLLDEPA